jgi:lipoprotein NlpI/transglutaminase-like putative cysteine protease
MHANAATPQRIGRVGRLLAACAVVVLATHAAAQTSRPARAKPTAAAVVAQATAAAPTAVQFVDGHRIAPTPSWVVDVDAPTRAPAGGTPGLGYRVLLSDVQTRLDAPGEQQQYVRSRLVATESAALAEVSKAELPFNPAYQTLTLHEAAVWRDGVRQDRLAGARIELLRREERLEQSTLTGTRTLLVVLNDVRIGDAVDIAYTLHGANPIFKGRFADNYQLTFGAFADVVHVRIDHPASRVLHVKGIRNDVVPEITRDGDRESLRIVRRNVPMVRSEDQVPAWYKVWPSVHVSEYGDWNEVAQWAEDLFVDTSDLGPELDARIDAWRSKGLTRDRLVAEVLEMVQDEVRYFSASLGESSHRPKAPARTYADRLGDCKDKVALLDAVLRRLGFDARPALVSVQRNRGIADYLPGHDQFDHVITRLQLDDKVYWLDPTLQKQGRSLDTRGQPNYGMVLVVAPQTQTLSRIDLPASTPDSTEFDHTWDLSNLKRAAQFTSIVRLRGTPAEAWRNAVAAGGADRIAENMAGAWARMMPGIRRTAPPLVRDDRDTNQFELELHYELPGFGSYERGTLTIEAPALEMLDTLVGPREARRDMPWLYDEPRRLTQRVRVIAPRRFQSRPPAPQDVNDKHFSMTSRMEVSGNVFTLLLDYTRKLDQVLPGDLAGYRERVQAARRLSGTTLRLPLLDPDRLQGVFDDIERRVQRRYGSTSDSLRELVVRQELEVALATEVLKIAGDDSPLAGPVLAKRAVANNMLNRFDATLADVDRALPLSTQASELLFARGLALLSLGRTDEAVAAMRRANEPGGQSFVIKGLGNAQYYQGQYAAAEASFREAAQQSGGEDRDFALIWLFLAAQRNGGHGREAIAPYVDQIDGERWPGTVVHYLAGRLTQDELLRSARKDKQMERLNLSEAWFYLGQQLLLTGDAEGARRMFQRTVDIGAVPYREHAFAQLELKRATSR